MLPVIVAFDGECSERYDEFSFLWFTVGLCVVAPVWAWTVELRCELRLVRRLDNVPGQAAHVVESPSTAEHRS